MATRATSSERGTERTQHSSHGHTAVRRTRNLRVERSSGPSRDRTRCLCGLSLVSGGRSSRGPTLMYSIGGFREATVRKLKGARLRTPSRLSPPRGRTAAGRGEIRHLTALWRAVEDLARLAGVGLLAVADLAYLPVVVGAEAVEDAVEAPIHVLPGVRELGAVYLGHQQELGHVHLGEGGERLGVGLLVNSAAHDEVADHLARHRVLGALVDPDLTHPRPGLEEEVVQQI